MLYDPILCLPNLILRNYMLLSCIFVIAAFESWLFSRFDSLFVSYLILEFAKFVCYNWHVSSVTEVDKLRS